VASQWSRPGACRRGCECPPRLALMDPSGKLLDFAAAQAGALASGTIPRGGVVLLPDSVVQDSNSRADASAPHRSVSRSTRKGRIAASSSDDRRNSTPPRTISGPAARPQCWRPRRGLCTRTLYTRFALAAPAMTCGGGCLDVARGFGGPGRVPPASNQTHQSPAPPCRDRPPPKSIPAPNSEVRARSRKSHHLVWERYCQIRFCADLAPE
jgi:hypothetical protein